MSESLETSGLIVITGATGWVGRTAMHELQRILSPEIFLRKVRAFASRECSMQSTAYEEPNSILIPVYSLDKLTELADSNSIQVFFHSAFLTRDKLLEVGFDKYVAINRWITKQFATAVDLSPKSRAVVISSGAAAAIDVGDLSLSELCKEDPYAFLKKEEEVVISETVASLVLRIYALSGRFMRKPERFALGDFLLMALRGEAIRINSVCPVFRSYGNASDITSFAWNWLLREQKQSTISPMAAVNIEIDLLSLARKITTLYGLPAVQHSCEIGSLPDYYVADSGNFLSAMSKYELPLKSLEEQLLDTAEGLIMRSNGMLGNG